MLLPLAVGEVTCRFLVKLTLELSKGQKGRGASLVTLFREASKLVKEQAVTSSSAVDRGEREREREKSKVEDSTREDILCRTYFAVSLSNACKFVKITGLLTCGLL